MRLQKKAVLLKPSLCSPDTPPSLRTLPGTCFMNLCSDLLQMTKSSWSGTPGMFTVSCNRQFERYICKSELWIYCLHALNDSYKHNFLTLVFYVWKTPEAVSPLGFTAEPHGVSLCLPRTVGIKTSGPLPLLEVFFILLMILLLDYYIRCIKLLLQERFFKNNTRSVSRLANWTGPQLISVWDTVR